MNFFSLISGKMVERWFSQSFRVGFSPAGIATAYHKPCMASCNEAPLSTCRAYLSAKMVGRWLSQSAFDLEA